MTTNFLSQRWRFVALAVAVLLAGCAVRLALHDYHGLEGDSGFSLAIARRDPAEFIPQLMRVELDIHPPLHFVVLKGWVALTGESLLGLRLFNTLLDLLTGALLMRLSLRVFDRRTALIAGLLWVAAPLLIHAGWLIRMYTLVTTLVTAATVAVFEGVATRQGAQRRVYFFAAGGLLLAAAYTHIFGVVAVGLLGLVLLVTAWNRRSLGTVLLGLVTLTVAGLLYVPYLWAIYRVFASGQTLGTAFNPGFTTIAEVPGAVIAVLLSLHTFESRTAETVLLLIVIAAAVTAQVRSRSRLLVGLQVFVWGSIAALTALSWGFELFRPRYMTVFVPPLLVLVAGAIAAGWTPLSSPRLRLIGIIALMALLVVSGVGVIAELDRSNRDDWLIAARFIAEHERPGEAVIVIPDWGQEAFRFHYDAGGGDNPATGIFPRVEAGLNFAPVLESLTSGHDRVWVVRYQPEVSDAEALADGWFRDRAVTLTEVFPAGMQVKYYDFNPVRDSLPNDAAPLDAQFGDVLALRGIWLPVQQGSARDERLHPPSSWVHGTLYWEALQPDLNVMPQVRFTAQTGGVYGAMLERENSLLQRHPIATWQPGNIMALAFDLNLNPQTPPGVYNIEVMVIDPATGEPSPASGSDAGDWWVIAGQYIVE